MVGWLALKMRGMDFGPEVSFCNFFTGNNSLFQDSRRTQKRFLGIASIHSGPGSKVLVPLKRVFSVNCFEATSQKNFYKTHLKLMIFIFVGKNLANFQYNCYLPTTYICYMVFSHKTVTSLSTPIGYHITKLSIIDKEAGSWLNVYGVT